MSNMELQQWIEQVSLEHFGVPFRHRAFFNSRLRSTGGRYALRSHDIEINPRQLREHGREEVEGIIKHELCHYHLHIAGRGYRHRDADFKQLLAKVGGSRYCQALPDSTKRTLPVRYKLTCLSCGMEYRRKRRMDASRYRCGRCTGELRLIELKVE
ncbi:SprT family protein [Saccharibacillus sp. O16]|nr:SprT family protein [Saccharibacillus sp. O16]